jgi:DNA/RNA endonuclease G (NUC1)
MSLGLRGIALLLAVYAVSCALSCATVPVVPRTDPRPSFEKHCGRFGPPSKTRSFGETYYVVHDGYVIEVVGAWKSALWAAHHVTASQLEKTYAGKYRRPKWKEEKQLPASVRARSSDYPKGGIPWNRGHLAPNADFGSKEARDETFILSNAVPQFHLNNQKIWSELEEMIRGWVIARKEAYVVTGGFVGASREPELMGESRVVVPTHLFKIVLAPKIDGSDAWEAIAVVLENRDYSRAACAEYEDCLRENIRSIDWIEAEIGLNFFSAIAEDSSEAAALESTAPAGLW